jgi:hypothetical protein
MLIGSSGLLGGVGFPLPLGEGGDCREGQGRDSGVEGDPQGSCSALTRSTRRRRPALGSRASSDAVVGTAMFAMTADDVARG